MSDQAAQDEQQAAQALRQLAARYAAIFETPGMAMVICEQDTTILLANTEFERLSGYSKEELEGKSWVEFVAQDNLERVKEYYRASCIDKSALPGSHEFWFLDRWQNLRDVLMTVSPIAGSQQSVLSLSDITQRKRVEETLRQRNRELALLNLVGQKLGSSLDLDQVLSTVLNELRRLMGVIASTVWLVDPETSELVCRQNTGPHSQVLRGWRLAPGQGIAGWVASNGQSLNILDTRTDTRHFKNVDRRTGVELRSILCVPLVVKERVIGVLQVVDTEPDRFDPADLTLMESIAASAAIAIENARLYEQTQQELAERKRAEDALRQHTLELQARNEELDAFAHTVAHDLKGLASRIMGFAYILEEDYAQLPDEQMRDYLNIVGRDSRKMSSIIDELLLLAGVRKMEAPSSRLDMGPIVSEALARLSDLVKEYKAEIIVPPAWPAAWGYGPWIEEVWVNYISNAIKYGGQLPRVELGATPLPGPPPQATPPLSSPPPAGGKEGGVVRFWVRDNGRGLRPEEQARLFIPFTQLGQISAKGHGLGLSIVRRILEKLGGQVGVESTQGKGSLFSFTLPDSAG